MGGYVLFVGYIVGLLLAGLPSAWVVGSFTVFGGLTIDVTAGMGLSLMAGAIAALVGPRFWRMGPRAMVWLMAGLLGVVAGMYLQVRSPVYDHLLRDISSQEQPTFPMDVGVQGTIVDAPQLTRSHGVRFTLHVTAIQSWQDTLHAATPNDNDINEGIANTGIANTGTADQGAVALHRVTQRLYVTVPLLQGTGLKPGDAIALHGQLDRPSSNHIPGAFDFQQYLERQRIFTTLRAEAVAPGERKTSSARSIAVLWRRSTWGMRQRIVRSFVTGLDSPAGPLLSAMVLGRKAVDLPFDIRDEFIQAGLAHILAASGFHVSLLLGVILLVTRRLSPHQQLWIGMGVLMGYASLTGLQPSVCRAVLMGVAVLVASATDRSVRPLGALLGIATVLLLVEPAWIWDLGFQLSFLATVGLVVMVPSLVKRMDALPVSVATAIAVPIAAMIWTLPILLRMMGTILPYSVILGVLLTPVIGLISLAGMVTGAIALVSPILGSALVSLLYWPLHCLITVVEACNRLPGQSLALGSISVGQLVAIYGLYIMMVWTGKGASPTSSTKRSGRGAWEQFGKGRWEGRSLRKLAIIAIVTLVLIPLFHSRYQKVQITVFPTSGLKSHPPFMLIQNRGRVGLINHGTAKDVQYTLLPFLRHQGINRLDWAIATQLDARAKTISDTHTDPKIAFSQWAKLSQTVPIRRIYTVPSPMLEQSQIDPDQRDLTQTLTPSPVKAQMIATDTLSHSSNSKNTSADAVTSIQTVIVGQSIPLGPKCTLDVISVSPAILELAIEQHHWLVMDHQLPLSASALTSLSLPSSDVWYWAGTDLAIQTHTLQTLTKDQLPLQAIITPVLPNSEMMRSANSDGSQSPQLASIGLYSPNRHHVVQWMPNAGLFIASDAIDQDR